MKRASVIFAMSYPSKKALYNEITKKYEKYVLNDFIKRQRHIEGKIYLPFIPNSDEFYDALETVKSENIRYEIHSEVMYTQKEKDQCEYFNWIPPYPLELEGTRAHHYGTQYRHVCEECGLRSDPIDCVLVDKKFVSKAKVANLVPDIIVSEDIMKLFMSSGISGVTFEKETFDYKGRQMPKYYLMDVKNILPPLAESTILVNDSSFENNLHNCSHDTFYLRSDLQYEREKLKNAFDINQTFEHLNNWRIRELVVSAKVRNLLKSNKLRIGHFIPIAII